MPTFDQARRLVHSLRAGAYPDEADFQVATWGWENADEYQILCGTYAMVYPARDAEDLEWAECGGPAVTVNKHTGEYSEHWDDPTEAGGPFRIRDATPIGEPQSAPQRSKRRV